MCGEEIQAGLGKAFSVLSCFLAGRSRRSGSIRKKARTRTSQKCPGRQWAGRGTGLTLLEKNCCWHFLRREFETLRKARHAHVADGKVQEGKASRGDRRENQELLALLWVGRFACM